MTKIFMLSIGWICLLLGLVGVILPVLPTTPFLLLTALIFTKNSKKCDEWFKRTKVYNKYVKKFKENKGLTLRDKLEISILVYTMLLISGLLVQNLHVRLFLVFIAIVKIMVMIKIPTIAKSECNEAKSIKKEVNL